MVSKAPVPELPRGWPVVIRDDAQGEAEEWRGKAGTVLGVGGRSKSFAGREGKAYAVIFDGEYQALIDSLWITPLLVNAILINTGGEVVGEHTLNSPLAPERNGDPGEQITVDARVWIVRSCGTVQHEGGRFVQHVSVKRYI